MLALGTEKRKARTAQCPRCFALAPPTPGSHSTPKGCLVGDKNKEGFSKRRSLRIHRREDLCLKIHSRKYDVRKLTTAPIIDIITGFNHIVRVEARHDGGDGSSDHADDRTKITVSSSPSVDSSSFGYGRLAYCCYHATGDRKVSGQY